MIGYVENPKGIIDRILESKWDFTKVIGYKINIKKSIEVLYTSSIQLENLI